MRQLRLKTGMLLLMSLLLMATGCQSQQSAGSRLNKTVGVEEYARLLSDKRDGVVVDVRTPEEYQSGHLEGALNIDYRNANFAREVEQLDKSKPVFVYCHSGGRSSNAAAQLRQKGFAEVYNLDGGITGWSAAGKPLTKGNGAKK